MWERAGGEDAIYSTDNGLGCKSFSSLVFTPCGFYLSATPLCERLSVKERTEAEELPPTTKNALEGGYWRVHCRLKGGNFLKEEKTGFKQVLRACLSRWFGASFLPLGSG